MGEHGKPTYDQGFFLALARRGRDEWNDWRGKNPTIIVTFQGVDFGAPDNMQIDFSGFQFGDNANFSCCRFRGAENPLLGFKPGMAKFTNAVFGQAANFHKAILGNGANLAGATFGYNASFSSATFGDWAYLAGISFGGEAKLSHVIFGNRATLVGATFGQSANLSGATFGHSANLSGTLFGSLADLSGTTFGFSANLRGATFGFSASLRGATFEHLAYLSGISFGSLADVSAATFEYVDLSALSKEDWTKEICTAMGVDHWFIQSWTPDRQKQFWDARLSEHKRGIGPDSFDAISFAETRFGSIANFSGRSFLERCNLSGTRFDQPPRFDDCNGIGNIDLYGSRIRFVGRPFKVPGWTTDSDVATRLRALRQLADETKNHDLERDLYIEERKAERGILFARYFRQGWKFWPRLTIHCLWIVVMGLYWMLADYGRSFIRPLLVLVASLFFFEALYSMMLPPPDKAIEPTFRHAVWAFTIANAVPFVGALALDKEVKAMLICGDRPTDQTAAQMRNLPVCIPVPTLGFQLLALGQSILSALLLFFIALALRNFFKLG